MGLRLSIFSKDDSSGISLESLGNMLIDLFSEMRSGQSELSFLLKSCRKKLDRNNSIFLKHQEVIIKAQNDKIARLEDENEVLRKRLDAGLENLASIKHYSRRNSVETFDGTSTVGDEAICSNIKDSIVCCSHLKKKENRTKCNVVNSVKPTGFSGVGMPTHVKRSLSVQLRKARQNKGRWKHVWLEKSGNIKLLTTDKGRILLRTKSQLDLNDPVAKGATIFTIGEESIRRYQRLRKLDFNGDKVQEIRRARGGVILDPDDMVKDVLDDNDFITISLTSDARKSTIIPEELKFVLDPLPNKFEPSDEYLFLDGSSMFIDDLQMLGRGVYKIKLTMEAEENVIKSRLLIEKILSENKVVYGITTGFGNFARTNIEPAKLEELQYNLIRSHAAGVGNPLSPERTRMLLALRINVLAKGYSGISLETLNKLIQAFNASCLSYVPEQGSVGASGDLAPLSHLALGLIGEGKMWSPTTGWGEAKEVLAANGLTPMTLLPKEGLCLINGTQMIASLGAEAVDRAESIARQADIVAALTLEVLKGTSRAFDSDVQMVRAHKGQIAVAKRLRALLHSDTFPSQIAESHRFCNRVQDAYTLRCCPQVHGIVHDTIDFIKQVITVEINSATDNPIVFAERGEIISAGNFHGEYPAKALDYLAVAIHELSSMSERRIERLVNPALSELPPFLVKDGGLNSGFMLAHCTAAALVSENKVLCHPASVDSLSTSAAQEDHVSMGCYAARKALQVVENVEHVLAIELLAACQAIEFLRPLKTTVPLEEVYNTVRSVVRPWDKDRFMSPDIDAVTKLLKEDKIWNAVKHHIDYYHAPHEMETRVFSPTAVMVGNKQREPPKTQVSPSSRGGRKRKISN